METRHGTRVFSFELSEAQWRVTSTKDSGPLSQDSDFEGRAKRHPSKEFKVRPETSPEQHAEEDVEGGETKHENNGRRNLLSISAMRGWIRFDAGGPWLERAGGPLVASLTVCGVALLVAAIAWRLGLL